MAAVKAGRGEAAAWCCLDNWRRAPSVLEWKEGSARRAAGVGWPAAERIRGARDLGRQAGGLGWRGGRAGWLV